MVWGPRAISDLLGTPLKYRICSTCLPRSSPLTWYLPCNKIPRSNTGVLKFEIDALLLRTHKFLMKWKSPYRVYLMPQRGFHTRVWFNVHEYRKWKMHLNTAGNGAWSLKACSGVHSTRIPNNRELPCFSWVLILLLFRSTRSALACPHLELEWYAATSH